MERKFFLGTSPIGGNQARKRRGEKHDKSVSLPNKAGDAFSSRRRQPFRDVPRAGAADGRAATRRAPVRAHPTQLDGRLGASHSHAGTPSKKWKGNRPSLVACGRFCFRLRGLPRILDRSTCPCPVGSKLT
jgi:hypothetical protein